MSVSRDGRRATTPGDRKLLLVTGWTFVLLGTLLPVIIATELLGGRPNGMAAARVVIVAVLLLLSAHDTFRPLRSFALALLAAIAMFNVRTSWFEAVGISVPAGIWTTLATAVLQAAIALALLVILLARGDGRDRQFLHVGDVSALAGRSWVPGFRRERPWWQVALLWAGVPWVLLVGYFLLNDRFPTGLDVQTLFVLIPIVLAAAVANAFGEEIVFRSAPLADLIDALGKRHTLFLLGAFFGLSHYYGTPGGPGGVVMTGLYAIFLTKCILETRGLGLALAIHTLADATIYVTYLG